MRFFTPVVNIKDPDELPEWAEKACRIKDVEDVNASFLSIPLGAIIGSILGVVTKLR